MTEYSAEAQQAEYSAEAEGAEYWPAEYFPVIEQVAAAGQQLAVVVHFVVVEALVVAV